MKMLNRFHGKFLYFFSECSSKYSGQCLRNGTDVLKNLSYNTHYVDILWDYIGLIAIAVIMHLLAFTGIRRIIRSVGYY